MIDLSLQAATWGAVGGFLYAGPKLGAALYAARKAGDHVGFAVFDFVISVGCATGASAALSPYVLATGWLPGKEGPHQMPAAATLLGYYFNQVGPSLLADVKARILSHLQPTEPKQQDASQ